MDMNRFFLSVCTAALAVWTPAAACAQDSVFFSPPGSNVLFGNTFSQVMVGSMAGYQSRLQQIDGNFVGNPLFRTVTGIAFRGDEAGTPGAFARGIEIEVRMAHGDRSSAGTQFQSNYVDTPVVVFPRAWVNAPDWSVSQAAGDYTFEIPFQTPWTYNLTDDLLWEVRVFDTAGGGPYAQDFYSTLPLANFSQEHTRLGPGCTTTNGAFTIDAGMQSIPGTLGIGFGVFAAPPSSGVAILLGAPFFAPVALPGFCAGLGTDGAISFPLGAANNAGDLPIVLTPTMWSPAVAGVALSVQAAALDATQPGVPVALSDSVVLSVPRSDGVQSLNCLRVFSQGSASATVGQGPFPTAVPVRFRIQQP